MEKHDEQIDQEQQQQTVIEQEDDMMTLIPKKNEQQDEYNFEKEGKLMEVFSRPLHNSGDEEKDDFPSPSPCKIARHETPDLSSASEAVALNKGHYDDLAEENDEQHQQKTTTTTINKCDPTEFSTSSSSCLNLSLSTSDSSAVVPKDAENNFEDKINDKNSLDISSYTLMFPDTTRHGSISTAPNGQVQNILVLNLPPGVNAVLSDQPSETQENVLMAPPDIGQPTIQEVTNLSSSSSPTSSTCTSTTQVACDTTTKNLINGVDPDDKARKCSIIEPNNTSRVKFLSQVTPESYVFNPTDQNLIQKNSLSAAFSSVSSSTTLKSDDLGRSLNSSNLEVENWQKFRDHSIHSKENSPTSILNGMQGFGPLANHIPISSYILDSNQMISEPPPQISQDPTMQATHQVCTLAASQIGGSQIQNTPHPKYGQLTFCHNGLIPQPPMKKEEEKPCPLNYLQSMNPNYNATVSRKTSSLLCLKSNLANSKENDPTRHLHNLNERKRRARITIACDFMRKLVPGLSDKTDKATVFEYAARYIHFLNAQVGKEYDANFLVKYCNY